MPRSVVLAARFQIVGRNPSRGVRRLERVAGVEVVGQVPDITEYLHRFGVVVAPLQIARGIQNKILEAMAASRPVVATPIAATGIQAVDEESILIAQDAESMAAQISRVLRDPLLSMSIGRKAHAVTATHYAWDNQLARLDAIVSGTPATQTDPSPGREPRGQAHQPAHVLQ